MNTQKTDLEPAAATDRRDMFFRAASLLSIMLGAWIFGAGADLVALIGVSPAIASGVGFFIGAYGVYRGGIDGMLLFVAGHVLLGSALMGGMIPNWLYALGVPIAIPGMAYRIIRPE
ncbi:hypothetical protein [Pseudomonas aeruginosa]|uniref:hypothetical protein n=1 Tax=Pseudomonas aeruginosa TaxID=287 RepID=UPI00287E98EB|nr:hypothetical protein [Pseudomonas aeruginosa]MDS9770473.1 hypothetical protein [Pseudomonas aeruginosa]